MLMLFGARERHTDRIRSGPAMQYPRDRLLRNRESQTIAQSVADVRRDEKAMGFLHRIAEWRAYLPRGSPHAEDIVADAIHAMLNGQIVCTPAAVGVELRREVRRRAEAYQRTVERSAEIPLDDAPASALISESADEGQDMPTRDAPDVVHRIRALASADAPVLHILELRLRGLDRRRDAWSIGMTPNVYRGARERLAVYAARAAAASARAHESTPFVIELDHVALRCK